jgi:hypothetical protein
VRLHLDGSVSVWHGFKHLGRFEQIENKEELIEDIAGMEFEYAGCSPAEPASVSPGASYL